LQPSTNLLFPYMVWAHKESFRSPYCLAQSGMPVPDATPWRGIPLDIGHPAVEALPALEARLAQLFGVAPERVLVTPGASAAMLLVALAFFRGARVVAEVPSYEPLRALPALVGAELTCVPRRLEHAWRLDPGEVERALGGRGPAHVFATNPHNPSGELLPAADVIALARAAERAGGVLACCEVYGEYLPNERRVHAFALAPNTISIGSLTKAYGLGGLRVGWMVLGEGLVDQRARLVDMAYLAYVDPPTASLRGAHVALEHLPRLLQPLRRVERESRPHWERWLRSTPGVTSTVPEHGIIAFARIEGAPDTLALGRFLQEAYQVDTVPGEFFGAPGHLRVACGVPEATLREGLERLTAGIAAWREQRSREARS
jgi:aspartate/methionine/tyrosine aminotransferase